MRKQKPTKKRQMDIKGNVIRRRLRRPKVSIVYTAGRAKTQFMIPKPREADRADILENLASMKISEL